MSMTLDEMKLAACEKLPELISVGIGIQHWITKTEEGYFRHGAINWPTEGLQVCHEAEKLLGDLFDAYVSHLKFVCGEPQCEAYSCHSYVTATYEQRLEALCRVWFPEKFN